MRRAARSTLTFLSSVLVIAWTLEAHADEDKDAAVAARRSLIEQAQGAREHGAHERALDLARRASQIATSPSLRRFIAEEEEALGLPAEALGSAEMCIREGANDGNQERHVAACRKIAERAKAAVGHVVVRLSPMPEGGSVRVHGVEVPRAVWGAPYVVSPGTVEVEVSAPGYVDHKSSVAVTRGAVVEVTVNLVPSSAGPAKPITPHVPPNEQPRSTDKPIGRPQRSWSVLLPVGGSVALAGAGVALGVGLAANGKAGDYESRCTVPGAPSSCASEYDTLSRELDTSALVVNLAIGVAVAGAITCATGFLLGMRSTPRTARAPSLSLEF